MSQGSWGGGGGGTGGGGSGGGGWGGGGYGAPPGGGYGPPPGGGGYGSPPGSWGPPGGGGGYGPPPGGFGGGGFAPQPAGYPPGYQPPTSGPVPWENSSLAFFTRWWLTTREVLFNPRVFFGAAAQSDDPWPSITYAVTTSVMAGLILGALAGLVYMIFGSLLATFFGTILGGRGAGGTSPGPAIFGIFGVLGLGIAVLYPIMFAFLAFVGPFINGGIYHLTLALFGGATRSYTHSVRVAGYSHASYLWLMIPIPALSPVIAAIFALVALVVGLDETHKCGVGKAILGVVSIYGLCCICWCGLQGTLAAVGAGAAP